MSKQLSVDTMVCNDYRRLLEESQSALEIWNEHRAEFCQFRFIGREAGDELLRLQAKCARAYTVLQNHERNYSLCQLSHGPAIHQKASPVGWRQCRRRVESYPG
jgi:hypothetical protein